MRYDKFPELNWERIPINDHCVMLVSRAKVQTNTIEVGEHLFMLIFSDKRKIRLRPSDLDFRDFHNVLKIMRSKMGLKKGQKVTTENIKKSFSYPASLHTSASAN